MDDNDIDSNISKENILFFPINETIRVTYLKEKENEKLWKNSFRSNMARYYVTVDCFSLCDFRLKSNCPSIFTEVMIERGKNLLVTAWSLLLLLVLFILTRWLLRCLQLSLEFPRANNLSSFISSKRFSGLQLGKPDMKMKMKTITIELFYREDKVKFKSKI